MREKNCCYESGSWHFHDILPSCEQSTLATLITVSFDNSQREKSPLCGPFVGQAIFHEFVVRTLIDTSLQEVFELLLDEIVSSNDDRVHCGSDVAHALELLALRSL